MRSSDDDDAVTLPIDGVLDLHHFSPKDIKTLVPAYLEECRKKGILQVRIIHGKGIGNLRRGVHALLKRQDCVIDFRLCGLDGGGWGATEAELKPLL